MNTGEIIPGTSIRAVNAREFIPAVCRNTDNPSRHHMYECVDGKLYPMCGYGWNRSGGDAFSILRGHTGRNGVCRLCERNIAADKPAVTDGFPHKTKWI